LRCLLVGKQVSFEVTFTTQGGREYGRIYLGNSSEPINISCVREGWCRIREDAKRRYENEDLASANYLDRLIEAEEEAKEKQVGVWCKEPRNKRIMRYQLQDDARVFLEQHKGKQLDAIIEQVRDGSTLRVQFIYPGTEKNQWIHQYATVLISGIRAPAVRAGTADKSETSEPFGEDAKSFVELRLLQRTVKIIIEGKCSTAL
jgi:staphylococcal nuclease domain-containing protein 1